MSKPSIQRLIAVANYLEVGRWLHARGYDTQRRVRGREVLWKMIADQVKDRKVLYLEFGVHEGASIRYWADMLRGDQNKFQGFDSFEGLPETWTPGREKGHFSLDGRVPVIDDGRVDLIKGYFQETLPSHNFPAHDVLIANFDADLYSSTIYVLDFLREKISVGSYLYFDEFNDQFHELRAFDEFIAKTSMKFAFLGGTQTLAQVLFQRIG